MKIYLECFTKGGDLRRRVSVTQSSEQGQKNIKNYLELEWSKVVRVESKEELETGFFE